MQDLSSYLKAAVVVHDAGAAHHICSWLQTGYLDASRVNLFAAGPASKVFNQINLKSRSSSLEQVLNVASLLISGTGWASSLEHDARVLAREKKVKSIAVIDHWTNYKERFFRDGKEVLPDEIWVTDEYALKLIKQVLPSIKASTHRNDYIDLQLQEIKKFSNNKQKKSFSNVLFVMEPIKRSWDDSDTQGEFQAFEYFVKNMSLLGIREDAEIVIKPHPSEQEGKYDFCLTRYNNLSLKINSSLSLAHLISWADIVVGCQTYAMVVAIEAGKKVISSMPPYAPRCVLPQKNIIHLCDLN